MKSAFAQGNKVGIGDMANTGINHRQSNTLIRLFNHDHKQSILLANLKKFSYLFGIEGL
jgi:hypothetical protein